MHAHRTDLEFGFPVPTMCERSQQEARRQLIGTFSEAEEDSKEKEALLIISRVGRPRL